MVELPDLKTRINNLLAKEAIMLVCEHSMGGYGPSGFSTCTKCNWSELTAHYNMYNNKELNK